MCRFLSFSLALIFAGSTFGQFDSLQTSVEWHFEYRRAFEGLPSSSAHYCNSYKVVGDTVADGVSYRKIAGDSPYWFYTRYEADSSLLKFYLSGSSGNMQFHHQIDYNLSVGDTFLLNGGWEGDIEMTVDSITYMQIGADSVKLFHLGNEICDNTVIGGEPYLGLYLIEGYGTSFGLWDFVYTCQFWNYEAQYLDVFIVNQDTIIGDFNSYCSTFTVNTEALTLSELHMYPNPASDVLSFDGIQEEALVQLVSLEGNLLSEKLITSLSTQLPLPADIPNGLYFVRVLSPHSQQTLKVLIMR